MIAKNMDDIEGEAVDIFSQVRKKKKILEVSPSKTTQQAYGTLQKRSATQSALLDTTPQAIPHNKITVLDLRRRGNLHPHKTGPISTKKVEKILNRYSSFTTVDPSLSNMGVLFPTTE